MPVSDGNAKGGSIGSSPRSAGSSSSVAQPSTQVYITVMPGTPGPMGPAGPTWSCSANTVLDMGTF